MLLGLFPSQYVSRSLYAPTLRLKNMVQARLGRPLHDAVAAIISLHGCSCANTSTGCPSGWAMMTCSSSSQMTSEGVQQSAFGAAVGEGSNMF